MTKYAHSRVKFFYWFILSRTENIKKNDGSFCLKDKSLLKFVIFRESSQKIPFEFFLLAHYVWLGGKRGDGVPGCGKPGVWWKTRGLGENTGSGGKHWVSKKNTGSKWEVAILLFQIGMRINQRETRFFDHERELNIS